jgi:nucleoside-diphosphate-sugar epimerase
VTGGTGFVGTRLVEMLIERGATKVISFDVVPPPSNADTWDHPNIEWRVGDITDAQAVDDLLSTPNIGCVWHNAAAVGPFHPLPLYHKVNYLGTLNILTACRKYNIPKLVFSSSPSTRFTGVDVDGLTEEQMPSLPLKQYMQPYAQTKAMAEMEVTAACCESLLTVSVAPHQVYGPRDNLFLPNLLEAAMCNKLHIFGNGRNRICFTHVDNYCHGLILAEHALENINSPACGKFYIVTDGITHPNGEQYLIFWEILNEAIIAMGFTSLYTKMKLPKTLLLVLATICELLGKLLGVTMKLNRFNVIVLTMHRWFDIAASHRDLNYTPIVDFREGWDETLVWFKAHWLTKQQVNSGGILGIATSTQDKIDIQDRSAKKIK